MAIYRAVIKELQMCKVCAQWVPRKLSGENLKNRMGPVLTFLTQYMNEGNNLLKHIVTVDKLWVLYCTSETKYQSMVWKAKDDLAPKKSKEFHLQGKWCSLCFGTDTNYWSYRTVLQAKISTRELILKHCSTCRLELIKSVIYPNTSKNPKKLSKYL